MKGKKSVLLAAALVLLIGVSAAAYRLLGDENAPQAPFSQEEKSQESQGGDAEKIEAPDFTVTDSQGNEKKLSDFEGKPVVVNFWATWCGYCKMEMPDFEKVFLEQGEEVEFVMVDIVDGQRETVEKGETFIEEEGFTFPVYFDEKQEAAYAYGINSLPTTLFIDKEGYLVAAAQQMIDEEILKTGIEMILEEAMDEG